MTVAECPSLVSLISAQSAARPSAPAVSDGATVLSYAELDARSDDVARLVLRQGTNTPIGIIGDRTADSIVALLGAMKAGAAYVPLDPCLPERRLEDIASLAAILNVLATAAAGRLVPAALRSSVLFTERAEPRAGPLPEAASPDRPLYILFTSGSTGQPKGVALPERALRNLVHWHAEAIPLRPGARVLQFASLGFDVASQEILTTLAAGGELVLVDEATRRDAGALLDMIAAQEIERLFLPVHALGLLADAAGCGRPPALRDVITSGEALLITPQVERFFAGGGCRLHNHYGPTEAHVVAAHTLVGAPENWPKRPPIGRPIPNVEISVRDPALRPVAAGAEGEICIGGIALALGYHRRPDLTEERFVADPATGNRLFRTGDLGRLGPHGFEYSGRSDRQVKIRGHRVEPLEVEVVLASHPAVAAAAVTTSMVNGGPELTAFVEPSAEAVAAAAREAAAARLVQARLVWDAIYKDPPPLDDPAVDNRGWTDSVSGRPIPPADMRDWADTTARRIRALRPRRVLEIGCGTGMLLVRLLPHCSEYVGTDISPAALANVRQACARLNLSQERLTLACQPAHMAPPAAKGPFDTVVLNSVVELFPSRSYLLHVLEIAVAATRSGGTILVGDVRNLALMEMFHTWVEATRADPQMPASELRARIQTSMSRESRLFVAPDLFRTLPGLLPRVTGVETELRRDCGLTEMSRYRYDAILHLDRPAATAETNDVDWRKHRLVLADLRRSLDAFPAPCRISGIPNARLTRDRSLLQRLREADDDTFVGQLRASAAAETGGVDAEALWALATDTTAARISFDTTGEAGDLQLLLLQRREGLLLHETAARPHARLTNDPLMSDVRRALASQLRRDLLNSLPDYLVPARIALVDTLPLTPSGKVERGALSTLPPPARSSAPPADSLDGMEGVIARVWREILGTEDIDPDLNFFDHGGTSLQLVDLHLTLCKLLCRDIDFVTLVRHPTVHALARHLDASASRASRATSGPVMEAHDVYAG